MHVKIAVESLRPSDDLHDPGASPLMVTGWNWNAEAARQHAFQWARMNGHVVENPPYEVGQP